MLTDEWQKLTERNYNDLNESFSGVFKKNVELPKKGFDRWRINNLATWKNVFLN
jgi:hypothetical protein